MYRSLDVVSSRSARLLGANRSIAEVGINSSVRVAQVPVLGACFSLQSVIMGAFQTTANLLLLPSLSQLAVCPQLICSATPPDASQQPFFGLAPCTACK